MTYSLEIQKTTDLLLSLTSMKQKEINLYKHKLIELQEQMLNDNGNSIIEYRYNLTKMRFDQLTKTTKGLRRLEQKIERFKY